MAKKERPDELVFWAYLRDELSQRRKASLEKHLISCSRCRAFLHEISKRDPVTNPKAAHRRFLNFWKTHIEKEQGKKK